jgi:poly(3-hydroxybutyrate) depolymerase
MSAVVIAAIWAMGAAAGPLGSYKVDPSSVSVSGLSSGGFMASQLGIAYSDVFQTGFGVFAAGPYDCARNQNVSLSVICQVDGCSSQLDLLVLLLHE